MSNSCRNWFFILVATFVAGSVAMNLMPPGFDRVLAVSLLVLWSLVLRWLLRYSRFRIGWLGDCIAEKP